MGQKNARIFDITWPISTKVAGWPGDTEFALTWTMDQAKGDSVTVSRLVLSPHTGTHADAPFHYRKSGKTIDQIDPSIFLGRARLIDVRGRSPIRVEDLQTPDDLGATRLLLRTGGWNDPTTFPDSIPVMDSEVPAYLQQHDIQLVGLDVPSVDVLDSKQLPIHRQLGTYDIHILEGLDLREPPPGLYELIALPLKVEGGDGAPVRAILRELAEK